MAGLNLSEEELKVFKQIHQKIVKFTLSPTASTKELVAEIDNQVTVLKSIRVQLMNYKRAQDKRIKG